MPRSSKWSLPFKCQTKIFYNFSSLSCVLHAPLIYLILLYFIILIIFTHKSYEKRIQNISSRSFGEGYKFWSCSVCMFVPPIMWETQVSHSFKIVRIITVLFISLFMFSERRQKKCEYTSVLFWNHSVLVAVRCLRYLQAFRLKM